MSCDLHTCLKCSFFKSLCMGVHRARNRGIALLAFLSNLVYLSAYRNDMPAVYTCSGRQSPPQKTIRKHEFLNAPSRVQHQLPILQSNAIGTGQLFSFVPSCTIIFAMVIAHAVADDPIDLNTCLLTIVMMCNDKNLSPIFAMAIAHGHWQMTLLTCTIVLSPS